MPEGHDHALPSIGPIRAPNGHDWKPRIVLGVVLTVEGLAIGAW